MAILNPAWLAEVNAIPIPNAFAVYAIAYPFNDGSRLVPRVWKHRTMKAATRRLASVCSGKLRKRNEHAAFVMDGKGNCYSLNDIRKGV